MDRRDFINRIFRGGLLASLAVISGILFSRRQVALQDDCFDDFQCRNCRKLNNCTLPEADKARVDEKG
ncbi:MAG: hypothetical protein KAR19_09105 [Bacteroidales bacterium]|nr:hypothetical protein [Bacteroidales bacterium]